MASLVLSACGESMVKSNLREQLRTRMGRMRRRIFAFPESSRRQVDPQVQGPRVACRWRVCSVSDMILPLIENRPLGYSVATSGGHAY
jgi:hypothetical protein